jgi:DNA-binding beta-propeller fold protein YncE
MEQMWALLAIGALLAGGAAAAEMRKVWEVTGLKNPESALYDPAAETIYVSNTNGDVLAKDGNGFISKVSPNGELITVDWVRGLDAPTGLALADGVLYVADVDRLVAIDPAAGAITATYPAPGAKFLNDLTADRQGRIFASDMLTDTIWMLHEGKLARWLEDEALAGPNGLVAENDRIVVGSWGRMDADGNTKVPGHLKVIDMQTKTVADLGDPAPVGNIDGVAPDGRGGYFISDWIKGGLLHATATGTATPLLPLAPGIADLENVPAQGFLLIPMSADGTLLAYRSE